MLGTTSQCKCRKDVKQRAPSLAQWDTYTYTCTPIIYLCMVYYWVYVSVCWIVYTRSWGLILLTFSAWGLSTIPCYLSRFLQEHSVRVRTLKSDFNQIIVQTLLGPDFNKPWIQRHIRCDNGMVICEKYLTTSTCRNSNFRWLNMDKTDSFLLTQTRK